MKQHGHGVIAGLTRGLFGTPLVPKVRGSAVTADRVHSVTAPGFTKFL